MDINLIDFLRNNILGKVKEILRLIISLGVVNVDVQVDRMLTPPEAKIRKFLAELPKKLTPEQEATFIAEVRTACDHLGNAVALAAKAQVD